MLLLVLALQVAAQAPTPLAERVAPGVIDTDDDEYGPTLTPDGALMVFTRRADRRGNESLFASRWTAGAWSTPERLPFSNGTDKEPAFSPDGRWLFFASTRPWDGKPAPPEGLTGGGAYQSRHDLWMVERTASGWGEPRPVPGGPNSNMYDSYPTVAASGTLYWAGYGYMDNSRGHNDLWRARRDGERWGARENLADLNTAATEADAFIAPDESYIIFSSDRAGGAGEGDLFVSFATGAGRWGTPLSLGPVVNTAAYEYTPWVTADGRWLYFSRGWGEIWRIETRHVSALRRQ